MRKLTLRLLLSLIIFLLTSAFFSSQAADFKFAWAKQFTSDLAFGKEVTVRIQTTDRYGRTMGMVILPDGKNLNWELVDAGLAWWYRKYAPNDLVLKKLETEAKAANRGLWAGKNPIPPWEWRKHRK